MVFLSFAGEITEWCLETGNAQFLPHPFQFIIHSIFPILICGTYTVRQVSLRFVIVKYYSRVQECDIFSKLLT